MGMSSKKAQEKKADFKKTRLKVGKAKAKASNFTDVSFKSKAIVIGDQFRQGDQEADRTQTFKNQLSLASSARSDKQRQSCLAFLTHQLSDRSFAQSIESHLILTKVLPLMLDTSSAVRKQLIDLLRYLPPHSIAADVERVSIFVRAGLTHMSVDVSRDALTLMNWLLDAASSELVACPGGWAKSLASFCAVLGWSNSKNGGWSAAPSKTNLRMQDLRINQLSTLTRLVNSGLLPVSSAGLLNGKGIDWTVPLLEVNVARRSIEHADILGALRAQDSEAFVSREARQQVFASMFLDCVEKGADTAKQEGGALGRAAAALQQAIQDGLADGETEQSCDILDIDSIW